MRPNARTANSAEALELKFGEFGDGHVDFFPKYCDGWLIKLIVFRGLIPTTS